VVPYLQREDLRAEWRAHLQALCEAYEELGSDPDEAVAQALEQFGDPWRLGRQWVREWKRGAAAGEPQSVWPATRMALRCFGLAGLVACGSTSGVLDHWTWGLLHLGKWAEPALCLGLPLWAGIFTGLLSRGRHALGTFYALAALTSISAGLAPLLPERWSDNTLILALLQFVFWMPAGCAAAGLTGWLHDRWLDWRRRMVLS
jgi:hypothetical protein